uniref:Tyrosine-protein phosphatase domain-containing protein n=2 Tax=Parascaris univalens TaxID=6257 RepID=A0A915C358_PARUN
LSLGHSPCCFGHRKRGMAEEEERMNQRKRHKKKRKRKKTRQGSKKYKRSHRRYKSTSKTSKRQRKKKGCGFCRARKTSHREHGREHSHAIHDSNREILQLPQENPAPIYGAAIQPPQATPTESPKTESAIPELPKEITKPLPEEKEKLAPTHQGDNNHAAQGKEDRVKSPHGINGTPNGTVEEAAGTNAPIASSQQTPTAASGDTHKSGMPDAKTSSSLPTSARESKDGTAGSARANALETSKTSVADTVIFKSPCLEEVHQVGDGQAAHKTPVLSASGSGDSIESKETADGRLVLALDGGLRLKRSADNEPKRRRRKAAEKIVNRSQSTIGGDEEDITLAVQTLNETSKRAVSQVRKVRAFVNGISREGLSGIRKSFIRCQYYFPKTATRISFDRNPTRVRYRDVICIDQTRVILKCSPGGSDFIHASRIPIGELENQIIITQLPLENTVAHFWEMAWQENAEAVLLLLTANEWKNHAERLQLIPSRLQCLHLGNMTITMTSAIVVSKNWIVYELGLTKDGRSRRIVWHHYSGWEQNKGGAEIQIIWKIHSSLRKLRRPLICMSMAGAGRAGTYAALEWAHSMHHDKCRHIVNVEECVKKVREYRMHSVQSLSQFEYIYMLMLRHIFLVKKIRDDYLSDQALQRELDKCIKVEKQYFRENEKEDIDDETEMALTCC